MTVQAFTDADLARLEALLTPLSADGSTMRADEVQGFFCAVASGPDALPFDEVLAEVLGDAPGFAGDAEAAEARELLTRMYFHVEQQLAAGQLPEMLLYEDDDGEADYWPWCNAYLYALDVVPTDWFETADDEGFEDLLYPVMALGGIFEQEDGEDLVTFTDAEIEGFKDELEEAVLAVYGYWRAKQNAPVTLRREGDKVGRNDPCPCGSGKKYKACCGKA
ncbi:YecA family protein [Crenobacter caeni]|uniref:YecA family protein n=1 Tax=Crenobacter caeni TaxID=2705474 RepID=A0A6B2KRN6_9NEIS|nr:YecA family protein [Crenobacter caeni]NDV12906.1 YecA family protein [Crenobacter caeni]